MKRIYWLYIGFGALVGVVIYYATKQTVVPSVPLRRPPKQTSDDTTGGVRTVTVVKTKEGLLASPIDLPREYDFNNETGLNSGEFQL